MPRIGKNPDARRNGPRVAIDPDKAVKLLEIHDPAKLPAIINWLVAKHLEKMTMTRPTGVVDPKLSSKFRNDRKTGTSKAK